MLITIGDGNSGEGSSTSELVGLLMSCHSKMRNFVALAARLSESADAPESERVAAAQQIRRYFSEALPLHVEDEEQSLLPRLRDREVALDDALQQMHLEHGYYEPLAQMMVATCTQLEEDPARHGELKQQLANVAAALRSEFEQHLAHEELRIIPAIERLLGVEEQAVIIGEIRRRRAGGPPSV